MEGITLTFDHLLIIVPMIISAAFGLWARTVHVHNKLIDARFDAIEAELKQNQKDDQENRSEFWKALNAIRDALQHTRENYVTVQRFEKLIDTIDDNFKRVLEKLDNKPNRNDCHNCTPTKLEK